MIVGVCEDDDQCAGLAEKRKHSKRVRSVVSV